jgi:hypothetical protein
VLIRQIEMSADQVRGALPSACVLDVLRKCVQTSSYAGPRTRTSRIGLGLCLLVLAPRPWHLDEAVVDERGTAKQQTGAHSGPSIR